MKNLSAKFDLNSLNFKTLPLFSWKRVLKITEIELELLTDVNMILDYKNGVRVGIPIAICHNGEASNKYMHDYGETKERTYIQYH